MMDEELTAHAEKSDGYHGVIIRSPNRHGVTTYTKDRSVVTVARSGFIRYCCAIA